MSDRIDKPLMEELLNISRNQPVFPGDTLSHETANRLAQMGLAKRDQDGNWLPTREGERLAMRWGRP